MKKPKLQKRSSDAGRELYHERALFVVAPSGAGKSKHLRHILKDPRFGTGGRVRLKGRLPLFWMSEERSVLILSQSPQEARQNNKQRYKSLKAYLDSIENKNRAGSAWRWNFAGALQPNQNGAIPNAVDCIVGYVARFTPERCRVCFLSPNYDSNGPKHRGNRIEPGKKFIGNMTIDQAIDRLWSLDGVEVITLDASNVAKNAFILADFFDFT